MQSTFNHLIKYKEFKWYLFWIQEIVSNKIIIWSRSETLSLSVAPVFYFYRHSYLYYEFFTNWSYQGSSYENYNLISINSVPIYRNIVKIKSDFILVIEQK